MERLFKVLNEDATPFHGGIGKWHLPQDGQPGQWMPPIEGMLIPCKYGYHLCREQDLMRWVGPIIYEAEYDGERIVHEDNKVVVRKARLVRKLDTWNERTARLFACDCAEHVLHLFEKKYPTDKSPRDAIDIARKFAIGDATEKELAAAWDAAAWDTAKDAAWDAAAWDTAKVAARDAAWDAAWDAARAAAWAAAWAAARDAAWDAAWAAAWAAAWDAAWDAAKDAAWDAERKWQTNRLLEYLDNEVK